MLKSLALAGALAATFTLGATAAHAAFPVYPNPGVVNPFIYTFIAANDGDIVAYFAGATAGFTSELGLLVNGVDTGINGLNNQTTPLGGSLNFGPVSAGDTLVFYINVFNTGLTFFSVPGLNPDGLQHIHSAPFAGGLFGIPAGTYVGFEDLLGGGDLDYDDLQFVFTNVKATAVIPEPATWGLMIAGFGMVGFAMRRRTVATA
jgi:hypothetical protein